MAVSQSRSLGMWPRKARAIYALRCAERVVPWARAYIPEERLSEVDLAFEVIRETLHADQLDPEEAKRLATESFAARQMIEERVLAGFASWYESVAAKQGMEETTTQHVVDLVSCALHSLAAASFCSAAVLAKEIDDQSNITAAEEASKSAARAASCVDFLRSCRADTHSPEGDVSTLVVTITLRAHLDDIEILDSATPPGSDWRAFRQGKEFADPWIRAKLDPAFAKSMDPDSWALG